jgi:formimidoylglutamate deiminase
LAAVKGHNLKPDWLWWAGRFHGDLALGVSADGRVAEPGSLPGAPTVRLAGRALLPGLVNGHSHAFQRLLRGRTEFRNPDRSSESFWTWRDGMYQIATALEPEELYQASRQAFLEMALAGITSVGEFHYLHRRRDGGAYEDRNELAKQVIRAAREIGLRIALLRVAYARGGHRQAIQPAQLRFIEPDAVDFLRSAEELASWSARDSRISIGIAPHSVRAVPRSWLVELARSQRVIHMHVSEQPAEVAQCLEEHGRRPVELLDELGLLRPSFTAVHAIHVSEQEVGLLARSGACACACPSTEANLGDGVMPADVFSRAGVPLSLGSDSQAEIDVLAEARKLETHLRLVRLSRAVLNTGEGDPDGIARALLHCATGVGARSLGLDAGELRAGAPADFFTVDLAHPSVAGASRQNLLASIVFGAEKGAIRDVAVEGELIVRDGRHAAQEQIGVDFSRLCERIFS